MTKDIVVALQSLDKLMDSLPLLMNYPWMSQSESLPPSDVLWVDLPPLTEGSEPKLYHLWMQSFLCHQKEIVAFASVVYEHEKAKYPDSNFKVQSWMMELMADERPSPVPSPGPSPKLIKRMKYLCEHYPRDAVHELIYRS